MPLGLDVISPELGYCRRLNDAVYVLHAFRTKSNRGIATPKRHVDLIKQRLKEAEVDLESQSKGKQL